MSRGWKVAIGVVVAVVVVVAIALPIAGLAIFRGRVRGQVWAPEMLHRWESGEAPHVEVELVDDDGDGVPDRGAIELPAATAFGHGRFVRERFVRGRLSRLGPGRGMLFGRQAFGLFLIVRGLICLALLAAVVVLGVIFYRRWRKAHSAVPSQPEA